MKKKMSQYVINTGPLHVRVTSRTSFGMGGIGVRGVPISIPGGAEPPVFGVSVSNEIGKIGRVSWLINHNKYVFFTNPY